jgi:hypothetical protein
MYNLDISALIKIGENINCQNIIPIMSFSGPNTIRKTSFFKLQYIYVSLIKYLSVFIINHMNILVHCDLAFHRV